MCVCVCAIFTIPDLHRGCPGDLQCAGVKDPPGEQHEEVDEDESGDDGQQMTVMHHLHMTTQCGDAGVISPLP